MAIQVGYEQAGVYSASDDRKINEAHLAQIGTAGGGNTLRSGVIPAYPGTGYGADGFEFGVLGNPPGDMTATVTPGKALVPPNYRVTVDAPVVITFAAVGANPRTDLVILRVYDTESGDASNKGQIEVVQGADGGGVPAVPSRALALWKVAFPANTTGSGAGTWTSMRQWTAAAGGVIKQVAPQKAQFAEGTIIYEPVTEKLLYRGKNDLHYIANGLEQYGQAIYGTLPGDLSQLRIRSFFALVSTDGFGVFRLPSGFTQCLVTALCNPCDDSQNIARTPFTVRLGNLSDPGFWALGNDNNGRPSQAVTVNGIMIGC